MTVDDGRPASCGYRVTPVDADASAAAAVAEDALGK